MNFELFGVRSVKRDGNPKKQGRSETSLSLRCAARAVGTSHGIYRQKRTYPHVPPIAIICRNDTVRNQRTRHHLNARTSHATEKFHLEPLQ